MTGFSDTSFHIAEQTDKIVYEDRYRIRLP